MNKGPTNRWHLQPLILVGLAVLGLPACNKAESRSPIVLFAVDGLEWRVLERLMKVGDLPNFSALIAGGRHGALQTIEPTFSPVIWTSIATGKSPEEHGIEHFVYVDQDSGMRRPVTSDLRKTKAFWNILSDYGREVHVIGWWATFPVEPINGVMISQTNTLATSRSAEQRMWKGSLVEGLRNQVYPPTLDSEVMSWLEEEEADLPRQMKDVFGELPIDARDLPSRLWGESRWSLRADAIYLRAAREVLERQLPFDLLAVYMGGVDTLSHRFWRWAFPEEFMYPSPPEEVAVWGDVIDDYYRHIDREIGILLDLAPSDVAVMVVSDHGMRAINADTRLDPEGAPAATNSAHHRHAPAGVLIVAGPPFDGSPDSFESGDNSESPPQRLGSIYDVLPTLLELQGIPVGRDMRGRVLDELLAKPVDLASLQTIDTHDSESWMATRERARRDRRVERERMEQLRALGYIQ